MVPAAAAAWSSVLDEIPELKGRLTASVSNVATTFRWSNPAPAGLPPNVATDVAMGFSPSRLPEGSRYHNPDTGGINTTGLRLAATADLPHLQQTTMEDYAARGARALQPLLDGIESFIDKQSSLKGLGPRLLDAFARQQLDALADELHGALLHAAAAAWSSILDEIPELKGRLSASVATDVAMGFSPSRLPEGSRYLIFAGPPSQPMTPQKAVDWFKSRLPMRPEMFAALDREYKARAFTVAAWTSDHVLTQVYGSTLKALEKGQSFSEWRKTLPDLYDADGVQVDNPHYLRNVFDNAMLQSYSVERYHGLKAASELRPYWRYMTVGDEAVRDSHQRKHGKVFRHDDSWWNSNYPPNGFRCRCYVTSLNQHQMEAQGLSLSRDKSAAADTGWDYNPALGPTARQLKEGESRYKPIPILGLRAYGKSKRFPRKPEPERAPTPQELIREGIRENQLFEHYAQKILTSERPVTTITNKATGEGVGITRESLHGIKEDLSRGQFVTGIREGIEFPQEIWKALYEDRATGRLVLRKHYLVGYEGKGRTKGLFISVSAGPGETVFMVTFFPLSKIGQINKRRTGILIYDAEREGK